MTIVQSSPCNENYSSIEKGYPSRPDTRRCSSTTSPHESISNLIIYKTCLVYLVKLIILKYES